MVPTGPDADNHMDPSVHYPLVNTNHPLTYSSMPLHMYPLTSSTQRSFQTKRRQVKNACTNCQRACKKCDDCRPCLRCVKYGMPAECVDSQRKERKKGVKRGPYKKRDCKSRADNGVELFEESLHQQQQTLLITSGEGSDTPSSSSGSSPHYVSPYAATHTHYPPTGPPPPPPPPPAPEHRPDDALAHQHPHQAQYYVPYPPHQTTPRALSSQEFSPPAVQYYQQLPQPGPPYHHQFPSYPPSYPVHARSDPHQQPLMHSSYPFTGLTYGKVDGGGFHLEGHSGGK
ncbi:hypothetical protein BT96DRAFT_1014412 [Gymnopus androsaceus JB14]|uniref:Zn(2)-C6 fungal-type domain-containing protein n=1 Tax=Gymnopus androsaceus JB14 TaxID=1447944 RepID=A0A6A4I4Y6_9AGAR|nr:hypothetical protein BT96DRAFT_1014412 [Gymnopus androsaceus JB14]